MISLGVSFAHFLFFVRNSQKLLLFGNDSSTVSDRPTLPRFLHEKKIEKRHQETPTPPPKRQNNVIKDKIDL